MTVAVTGAGGFVGGHLTALLSETCSVRPLTFSSYASESLEGVDAVVHLAALVHQTGGAPESEYFRVNTEQTLALAREAKERGVRHFVFMSSIKVCGERTEEAPFDETSPCGAEDAYGRSKYVAEQGLRLMEDERFTVSVVRAPLIYGEGVKANMLRLLQLVDRLPLLPLGGIENRRSLLYVGNLTAMIRAILEQRAEGLFLAADPEPLSTTQLVRMIADALGKTPRLLALPAILRKAIARLKPGLYERLFASLEIDNRRSLEALAFTPPFQAEEGIRRMAEWYRHG